MNARAERLPARGRTDVRTRLAWTLGGFGLLAVAAILLAPLTGGTAISLAKVFDRSIPYVENIDAQIFFVARLPRVLAAALVGSALALAGVVFQALLRNPLASPDTLGVSAGASLGAMLAITFNADFVFLGISTVPLASFTGSLGALAIVYGLSVVRRRGTSTMVLLLGGVTLTALLSAVMGFVQFVADFTQTFRNVRWMMGSLDVASYAPLGAALLPLALAAVGFATLPRVLDLVSVGAESAAARGVDVKRTERVALVSASLATGAAVSLAGPVAFIGIIVPHLVRLVVGADHRLVLPGSALLGAALLIGCDVVARTAMAPLELPVGIVTALVGGPVFLWVLFRRA
ncbi:MAG TPA: iron ABC transporter permease [Vicinamibacterales bacterium]|nr:iron ABC transporter permease [Vicinamibacterales bacterium]